MSQCARVALWVPTENPPDIGDGVVTKNVPDSIKAIATRFLLGGGGGGGGITDAPADGKQYARKNNGWEETPPAIIDAGTF